MEVPMSDAVVNALAPRIENSIRRLLPSHRIAGVVCAIVRDQELAWSGGFGFADIERGLAPDRDTIFRCGSITKTFTGAALMQLRDDGKLALDAPIVRYITEFKDVKLKFGTLDDITLLRLMSHHSGLVGEVPGDYWETLRFPNVEEVIAKLPQAEVVIAPDAALKYSNLAYTLLGEVIARVSGVPYVDYVRRNFLEPLGMTTSGFDLTDTMRPLTAIGYQSAPFTDVLTVAEHPHIRGMTSAGQLYSSAADLAKWIALQFRTKAEKREGAQVLRGATISEMHRAQYLDPAWLEGECLAWRATRRGENIYHHHSGGIHGFLTFASFSKRDRTGVIVLTNSSTHAALLPIAWEIYDTIIPAIRESIAPPVASKPVPPPDHLRRFLGRYVWRAMGVWLDVVWREGSLAFGIPAPPARAPKLLPTEDPNTFVVDSERPAGERMVFETEPNGSVSRARLAGAVYVKTMSAD
jgi:CubicO group peptidase (beta-lactamase class C family)